MTKRRARLHGGCRHPDMNISQRLLLSSEQANDARGTVNVSAVVF